MLIVLAGEIIKTPRSYLNVDCFVMIIPCASIPFTDNVLVPINGDGLEISTPPRAQLAVEVDTKLSY